MLYELHAACCMLHAACRRTDSAPGERQGTHHECRLGLQVAAQLQGLDCLKGTY